ncbi:sigma-54-dependent transcriptional regulator [Desulfoluna spongiiphila]|uniref:DNA-binding transcriptional response regulator, NtrC family, contains REC, AAA-type ATPase, and a Fis-type DNA-binding domains n=1 Tax=Desulfoluna spongiiphila TaxID=419481 RepID=A0A1G5IZK4_9BACT|nr:sigma-54 dependent transcriptional regulator [Desulfoluna spongiiphila]SCY81516.1 DNA-binding transcriptional response regulator, NtrC family, contains REC, AAA-type ATPase, and a Fis-type DNA-binding domains [Desulfoluna spongiiphila]
MTGDVTNDFPILLIDDEPSWLRSLGLLLERAGFANLRKLSDGRKVRDLLAEEEIGIVLLDLMMPDMPGEELISVIREESPDTVIVVVSGMNQVNLAVRCMKMGASDYIVKTGAEERIVATVRNAVNLWELKRENRAIRSTISKAPSHPEAFSHIATANRYMVSIFSYIESLASSRQPVLITGESGTGKELIARAIHRVCNPPGPMVAVNVAGLDDTIFSDTLFGHVRGAFTGADSRRAGMVEKASGGTLFLDEIGDLSAPSQVKLLRLLQDGDYYPVGSDHSEKINARVVCSTHQDLTIKGKEGKERRFRKDLFYRLQTHHIHMPPLRERKDDIPVLLDTFLAMAAEETGKKKPAYPQELPVLLATYHFPGNIRELKSMVFDAVARHQGGTLSMASFKDAMEGHTTAHLEIPTTSQGSGGNPFSGIEPLPSLSEASQLLVMEAMARAEGNQSIAARILGISQPALSKRMKHLREKQEG